MANKQHGRDVRLEMTHRILEDELIYTPTDTAEWDYLIGINQVLNRGIFLISTPKGYPGTFGITEFQRVFEEARKNKLLPPYVVYGGHNIYNSELVEFKGVSTKENMTWSYSI